MSADSFVLLANSTQDLRKSVNLLSETIAQSGSYSVNYFFIKLSSHNSTIIFINAWWMHGSVHDCNKIMADNDLLVQSPCTFAEDA